MADPLPWPVVDPLPPGWLGDTPDQAVRVWRAMPTRARARAAHALWRTARRLMAAGERMRHPAADAAEVEHRVRARLAAP